MGVKGLLGELPGGDVHRSTHIRFSKLEILRNHPADANTGILIFIGALRHNEAYNGGGYIFAACEFQRQIIALNLLYKWDYTLVFDGHLPK